MCWCLPVFFGAAAHARAPQMIDAHSHYTAADAAVFTPNDIVGRLDAAGVGRIAISGTPPELARTLHAHAPERVIPLLGVYASHVSKAMWMHDRALPARVAARVAEGGWAGIGELHIFSYDVASPVLAELVRIAARARLMLLIHGDAVIIDRIFELEPEVRVLWAHLGTVPDPDLLEEMLDRHAERALWVDTSVRDMRIAMGGSLRPEWRALIERHPERFVVAVDTFSPNRWRNYGEVVEHIRSWTASLSPPLQEALLYRNAEALFAPWLERAGNPPAAGSGVDGK